MYYLSEKYFFNYSLGETSSIYYEPFKPETAESTQSDGTVVIKKTKKKCQQYSGCS